MRRWMFGLSALVGTTALVMACSVGDDCDFGLCAGPAAGSDGGDGADVQGDVVAPPGCKPELDPKDAPACVVDSYGVFVDAAKGADGNPGTKAAPLKTFTAALAKAGSLPRVYVCEGTYAEHVKLTRGVSIYGGFACADWAYSGAKAKIAPSDVGFALHIAAVTSPVVVADLEMVALPGTKAAPSSIGAFVARSTDVTMRRVKVTAGTGFTGANGEAAKPAEPGTSVSGSINGNPGTAVAGGLENVCTCSTGGTTTGGKGGDPTGPAPNGTNGALAQPVPAGGTGAGGTRAACETNNAGGLRGSDAPPGAEAASPGIAVIDDMGWTVADGQAGKNGTPGQGGGGGGSYTIGAIAVNGGGGGGACGGCGGGGGGGGAGGGSSLAVLAHESTIKLEASALAAANAGSGGAGAPGEAGATGGAKGNTVGNACQGGVGGDGGKGGSGAGGSGGISAGVLHKGPAPTVDPATEAAITVGKAGEKGTGGTPQMNDGKPGDAKKIIAL